MNAIIDTAIRPIVVILRRSVMLTEDLDYVSFIPDGNE
jgi:hypothetical protein